jgi:putative DNA methylase
LSDARLIETYLPVQTISRESGREKNAGRGHHPSTLHWWWARRPLAACRSAVLATLLPASAFPEKADAIEQFFGRLGHWHSNELGVDRQALAKARELIASEWNEHAPRVIDSFVGGGAIPLEVLRLGGVAAGVELNPVAYIVGMGTVVWPQRFGGELADDVLRWGAWVRSHAVADVSRFYPRVGREADDRSSSQLHLHSAASDDGSVPLAYLWTRTVKCPNPALRAHDVPLTRMSHVVRTARKRLALKVVPNKRAGKCRFEIAADQATGAPRRRGRSSEAACPLCGASVSSAYLRDEGALGRIGFQLVAVICARPHEPGKQYIATSDIRHVLPDPSEVDAYIDGLSTYDMTPPSEAVQPMGNAGLASGETYLYGIDTFEQVFTRRQLATLLTLCRYVREAHGAMLEEGMDDERANVVSAYLGMAVNRVVDRSTALCRWDVTRETVQSPFVRDRLAMVWDFVEVNPFAGVSGDSRRRWNQWQRSFGTLPKRVAPRTSDGGLPPSCLSPTRASTPRSSTLRTTTTSATRTRRTSTTSG